MKKKILRIVHSLDTVYGGPQNAINDHSIFLNNNGFNVEILTNGKKNKKNSLSNNFKVHYMGNHLLGNYGFNYRLFLWLYKNKKNYDYFIIHGLWSFYTLAARILIPNKYFVFSHGQLDPFFSTEFFKKLKKKIYWFFIEKRNLLNSKSLLLTTKSEKNIIENTYVNTKGISKTVIKYGLCNNKVNKNEIKKRFLKKNPTFKNKKYFLFLGRFHKKKGCEILLKSFKNLNKKGSDYILLMAGSKSVEQKKLIYLSNKLGISNKVFWLNFLDGETKLGAILNSKAMVLCSYGENFGVSLVESLRLSKPVITTDKVNIYKSIIKYGAGFISKNNILSFSKNLIKFSNLSNKQLNQLSKNSFKCFDENFNLSVRDKSLKKIFN